MYNTNRTKYSVTIKDTSGKEHRQHNGPEYRDYLYQKFFKYLSLEMKLDFAFNIIGSGGGGISYRFIVGDAIKPLPVNIDPLHIKDTLYRHLKNKMIRQVPPKDETLHFPDVFVMKVQHINEQNQSIGDQLEKDKINEDTILHFVSRQPGTKKYVPEYYFGGTYTFYDGSDIYMLRITCMECIQGIALRNIPAQTLKLDQTMTIIARIEQACVCMWKEGITHLDINQDNILIIPGTLGVKIIDFGYARYFPEIKKDLQKYTNIKDIMTIYKYHFLLKNHIHDIKNRSNVIKLKQTLYNLKKHSEFLIKQTLQQSIQNIIEKL